MTKSSAKYYPLNNLGLLSINGPDTEKFLQGQLTCDVNLLNQTPISYGAHCDPKGRILFNFQLLKIADEYIFLLPQSMLPQAMSLLKKYLVFYRSTLQDISHTKKIFGVSGNTAALFDKYLTSQIDTSLPLQSNDDNIIIKISADIPRYVILTHQEPLISYLQNHSTPNDDWTLQNIAAGIADIYPETSGMFTPHEINLPQLGGVSFNKGCYTGQEIVARMQYLGKLKSQMFRIEFSAESLPTPGTPLYNEQKNVIGHIVIAAEVSPQQFQALAVLPNQIAADRIFLADSSISIGNKFELSYSN